MSNTPSVPLNELMHEECVGAFMTLTDSIVLNPIPPSKADVLRSITLHAHELGVVVQYLRPDYTQFASTYDYLVMINGDFFKLRRSEFEILSIVDPV